MEKIKTKKKKSGLVFVFFIIYNTSVFMLQCSSAAQPIARLASGMSQALGRVLGQLGTGEKLQ